MSVSTILIIVDYIKIKQIKSLVKKLPRNKNVNNNTIIILI